MKKLLGAAGLVVLAAVFAGVAGRFGYVAAGLTGVAISVIGIVLILRSFPAGPRW